MTHNCGCLVVNSPFLCDTGAKEPVLWRGIHGGGVRSGPTEVRGGEGEGQWC